MARINVNLNDVEGFAVVPDGVYLVEIQESSKITKSKAGNPNIRWIGKILEGDYEGKLISWNTVILDTALWKLKDMLEKIGVPFDEDGFDHEDAFGKELYIRNEQREYDNKPQNDVVEFFSTEMPPDEEPKDDIPF